MAGAALEVARRRGVDASAARRRELAAQERAELLAWFATFAEPLRAACRARCGTPDDDFAAVHWYQFRRGRCDE